MSRASPTPRRAGLSVPVGKVALAVAIGSMTLLFAALASAYVVRMGLGSWTSIRLIGFPVVWLSTLALATASMLLVFARRRVLHEELGAARKALWAAGGAGCLFVLGQVFLWIQLQGLGFVVATNPASSFFYLITAIHGVHVLAGLVALFWTSARLDRGAVPVEVTGLYWHFLLAVWLGFFGLMLVT